LAQPFFWNLIERILDEVLSELTGRSEGGAALSLECQTLSRTKNPTTIFNFPQTREKLLSNRSRISSAETKYGGRRVAAIFEILSERKVS